MKLSEPIAVCFSHQLILDQVCRIKQDRLFKGSKILRRFLDFIVSETLEGGGRRLKEYTIALNVLDKPKDFDPKGNCTVRIHAFRLRKSLADYYKHAGLNDRIRIYLPVGTYVPVFEENIPSQHYRVKVTVQMINADSGEPVWSESIEKTAGELHRFDVHDEMLSKVVDTVNQMVEHKSTGSVAKPVMAVA